MNLVVEPQLPSPETSGVSRPIFRRSEEPDASRCPCGQTVEAPSVGHVLCAQHRQQVHQDVNGRFGSHRYGGRYSHSVEDFVQECYERLLKPGGLNTFQPMPERPRAAAFGAWLNRVVQNYCHNKLDYLLARPTAEPADAAHEPSHAMTPDQAFARAFLNDLAASALAEVEAKWKQNGLKKSLRFEVFLQFLNEEEDDYVLAQMILGVTNVNAKQIKHQLSLDLKQASRFRVRDTLYLEPGLDHAEIERRIDAEIVALFQAAFPEKPVEPGRSLPGADHLEAQK